MPFEWDARCSGRLPSARMNLPTCVYRPSRTFLARLWGGVLKILCKERSILPRQDQSSVKSAFAPRGIRRKLIVVDAKPANARICPAGPPTRILTIEAVRLPTAITARRLTKRRYFISSSARTISRTQSRSGGKEIFRFLESLLYNRLSFRKRDSNLEALALA